MHSGIPAGNGPEPGAALNGIQLRLMTAEPPLFVDPVELDTYFAGGFDVIGNVVELMYGNAQLQPVDGQQREPDGAVPLS